MKLAISGADEHLALVPGVDLAAFTVLSPENPEHTLFLLNSGAGQGLLEVAAYPCTNCVGDDVDGERDHRRVEEERQDAVQHHHVCAWRSRSRPTSEVCAVVPTTKEK